MNFKHEPAPRKKLAVDTETTGLNMWTGARPFMTQLLFEDGEAVCFEWDVNPKNREVIVPKKDKKELIDILSDPQFIKGFFNGKFDMFMLEAIGVTFPLRDKKGFRLVEEVSWMARMVNNLEFSFGLKPLAKKYLKYPDDDEKGLHDSTVAARRVAKKLGWMIATKDTHGKEPVKADYWLAAQIARLRPDLLDGKIDPDACYIYGMGDVDRTLALWQMYEEGLNEYNLWEAYDREMQVLPITMEMERDGVRVDVKRMEKVRAECEKTAKDALDRMCKATGNKYFNPNSPQQVQEMLFNGMPLELEVFDVTKTGQPSTGAEALEPHFQVPLVRDLLTYKANTKAIGTFFDKYAGLMTPDNKVHPGYKQLGTVTTRYSCIEPNLQQVSSPASSNSKAREFLVDIRQVFCPDPGWVMFAPDYKQMEVIIFAAIYNVQTMLKAIRAGQHVHKATADKIYGGKGNPHAITAAIDVINSSELSVGTWFEDPDENIAAALLEEHNWSIISLEDSLKEESYKKRAKSATFTKIFGGGWRALMGWLPGVSAAEARQILDLFDSSFPDMAEAMAEIEHRGRKDGFVITPYGVRLGVDRWYAYRIINHVVQSSAASQMKLGMLKCMDYIRKQGLQDLIKISMTVHDELIFQIRKGYVYKKVLRALCSRMGDHEGRFDIALPVDADIIKERWSEKEPVKL